MRKLLLATLLATALAPNLAPNVAAAQAHRYIRHEQRQVNRERRTVNRERRQVNRERVAIHRERVAVNRQRAEDWREYRRMHREVFRRPVYVAPRGYRYSRVAIGYRLAPAFWARPYWIDYGYYRLPPPPPGTMYVRYGNDVLLISLRSGRVIAVYEDFFY